MFRCVVILLLIAEFAIAAPVFKAGVHRVDITPTSFPVRVNGGFAERSAQKAHDPLYARAFALDDGKTQLLFCIVDTCMMPRDLIDQAKTLVTAETDIPTSQMMVSATHTHSAPAAMGCLGSRADEPYAATLPAKLAEAMLGALEKGQPAQVGWASIDAPEHTFNRRWIARLDRVGTDPFGQRNVIANMHPGHRSPNVIGPSGPVDSELSILAFTTLAGKPLGLLANFSQHYCGAPLLSADYFGAFSRHMAKRLDADEHFVAAMSQGTSGDLMWMNYGAARKGRSFDHYADEVAEIATQAYADISWHQHAPLSAAEELLDLAFRVPDAERLAWAQERAQALGDRLPRARPDIYALEALHLNARPRAELKLQAIHIGELGIATLPNEVYALTGLQLKAQSPFAAHFNISLANGAEGYIPPPAQFALGGYTTWPARTAGLEQQAEPKIVEALLGALNKIAPEALPLAIPPDSYSTALRSTSPSSHWPLDDMSGDHPGKVAYYLPGVAGQALHLADGSVNGNIAHDSFSIGLWFWLGVEHGASNREGSLIDMPGVELTVEQNAQHHARVLLNGEASDWKFRADDWHFAMLTAEGDALIVSVDGKKLLQAEGKASGDVSFGRGLEGKLDEIAIWPRAVSLATAARLFAIGNPKKTAPPPLPFSDRYTASLRFRNDLANNRRPVTAYLFSRGPKGNPQAPGDHLGIGGTYRGNLTGKLIVFNGNATNQVLVGKTTVSVGDWHQVKMTRDAYQVRVWLNGELEIDAKLPPTYGDASEIFVGTRSDDFAPLQGETADFAYEDQTPDTPPAIKSADPLASIRVPDGFMVELVAAEPEVMDPIAIDWSPDGRLWVVEMADYPYGIDGKSGGRVRWLEDRDGDGRYEHSVLFLEGLNFPTGVMSWRDGVLITAAPEIIFAADRDDDGIADHQEVLFSGFKTGNQQLRVNGLRRGLDGWVHLASGAHHAGFAKDVKILSHKTGEVLHLGSRDLRIRPDTGAMDALSGPSQFGRTRDNWGNWFGVQNGQPLWHYQIPDRYLRQNPDFRANPKRQLFPKHPPVFPASAIQKRYHNFKEAGRFTSACGITIYKDSLLFPIEERHAFVCEPFHNLVQHIILEREGESFRAERAPGELDFFTSTDRWCRPVMARTGPDGALWIVDMHRYMIEHPDWLPAAGKKDLKPRYRDGADKGRIYRVFRTNALPRPLGQPVYLPSPLARARALAAMDSPPADRLLQALTDDHPELRALALRLCEDRKEPELQATARTLLDDPIAFVRFQARLSLNELADSATEPKPANPIALPDIPPPSDVDYRAALELTGDATRGEAVFKRLCIACHANSARIGPDLRALTERSSAGLFTAITQPNAAVDPGFVSYSVTLTDGQTLHGRITRETGAAIVLSTLDGHDRRLLRSDINTITAGKSLMPEGLERAMTVQQLADLIQFLKHY